VQLDESPAEARYQAQNCASWIAFTRQHGGKALEINEKSVMLLELVTTSNQYSTS
jgi:hypothetical protein